MFVDSRGNILSAFISESKQEGAPGDVDGVLLNAASEVDFLHDIGSSAKL